MKELAKQLDNQQHARWDDLIAQEGHLLPFILLQQRTMRGARLIPIWHNFEFSEVGWAIKRKASGLMWRKLKAWWELIFDVSRWPEDKQSVELAVQYAVQAEMNRTHNKLQPVDPLSCGITDQAHILKVQIAVMSRFQDLLPRQVAGVDIKALLRPKYEPQPEG